MTIPYQLYNDPRKMPFDGYPMSVGMPRSGVANETPALIPAVEKGKVAIIKKLIVANQGNLVTSPSSPGAQSGTAISQANLLFGIGGSTKILVPFLGFARNPTMGAGDIQALPVVDTVWEPKGQIVLPETWDLRSQTAATSSGGIGVVYQSHFVETAKQLGYSAGLTPPTSSAGGPPLAWVGDWVFAGVLPNATSAQVLAGARTGFSFHVTDIFIRCQPQTLGATVSIQDTNNANIYIMQHDSRNDPGQQMLKVDLWLPNDLGLQVVASTNAVGHCSVAIIGHYVPNIDKPSDAWYSFVQPQKPSPTTLADGIGNRAASTVKAAPGKGYRHIVNGYAYSLSRTATVGGDGVACALTVGTASATFGAGVSAIGPGNNALSPVVQLGSQNQTVHGHLDEVNIPCPENQAIFWESRSILSPSNTEAEIDGWGVLVWGRTREAFGNPSYTANFTGAKA